MKTRYRSRLTGEFFRTEEEVIGSLKKENVEGDFDYYYDIIELSEEDIEDLQETLESLEEVLGEVDSSPEPTENLDEKSGLTEEEIRGIQVLKDYKNIEDEETKKAVLSVALGQSTGHDKKFPRQVKTGEAIEEAYKEVIEKLGDERSISCPLCHLAWSRISGEMKEKLSEDEKHKIGIPLMRVHHVQSSHPSIWNLISYLFEIPKKTEVGVQRVKVSNPESCCKEELAQVISESPELRKEIYREWIKKLQKRE